MAKTAATRVNLEDKPMFMQDITKLTTAFSLVTPRVGAVIPAPVLGGIVAGTLVEGEAGWCAAETLRVGDRLQTLDGGLARIIGLDRRVLAAQAETALIHVPGGIFDACSDLWLVPGQHVLVDTVEDADHCAPHVLLPALALTSAQVRHSFPEVGVEVITPMFADEEIVFANSGVMLHCPSVMDGAGRYPEDSFFPRLDVATARAFLTRRAARLAA
jgi:hypothetical protein